MMMFLAQESTNQGSQFTSLIFLVVIFGAMYFLMIRPQQKRRRQYMDLLGSLSLGDEVETVAGIFGTIRKLTDEHVWLEVAPGLQLKMSRGAIRRKIVVEQDASDPS